jgi:hypothetical protein
MSDQCKHLARRFQEALAAGDTAALEEIVAEDVVDHTLRPGQPPGRQPLIDAWRDSQPDSPISRSRSNENWQKEISSSSTGC